MITRLQRKRAREQGGPSALSSHESSDDDEELYVSDDGSESGDSSSSSSSSSSSEDDFLPPFSAAQTARIDRMQREPLYLMAIRDDNSFHMTGSTGNLYVVRVNARATSLRELATCNCPDAALHAARAKVLCKHACFVVVKALRLPVDCLRALPYQATIETAIENCRSRNWGHLSDREYQERYARYLETTTCAKDKDNERLPENPFVVPEDASLDEEVCAICLDDMTEATECSRCPSCRHYYHKNCIAIWLAVGDKYSPKKCPLCRASWAGYGETNVTVAAKRRTQSGFVNLSNFC